MDRVLFVIDCQNDFMPEGSLAVPKGDEIVPVINELLRDNKYTINIFTKDWHPKNHKSFASNNNVEPFTIVGDEMKWTDHCVQDTEGAKIHKDITIPADALEICHFIIHKGTNPTFEEYSALSDIGNQDDITYDVKGLHVDVVGLATDYCVKDTVLDLLSKTDAKSVNVLLKGCRGIADDSTAKAIEEMKSAGAEIVV